MAVRFDAAAAATTGDRLLLATGLASQTNYSITCWIKVSVSYANFSTFWSVGTTSDDGNTANILQCDTAGLLIIWTNNARSLALTPTVGTWYFVGVSFNGTSATYRIRAEGAGSFQTGTFVAQGSHPNGQIRFGNSHYANEALNGCVEAVKWWSVSLTALELEAEYTQRNPVKTANLRYYWKFTASTTVDDSGNGGTLTARGTPTLESGPASLQDVASGTSISVSDTGASAETLAVSSAPLLTDTASESESLTVARAAALNDSASSVEALAASTALVLSESGSAAEQLTITRAVNLNDSGLTTDALSVNAATTLTDAGNASDSLTTGSPVSLSDTGTGVESLTVTRLIPLAETGSASDAVGVSSALVLTDAGTGADSLTAAPLVSLVDTGTAEQALAASALVALGDSATSSTSVAVSATTTLADTASATESVVQGAAKAVEDTGQAVEALTVSVALSASDTASGVEALLKDYAEILLTDSGSAHDVLSLSQAYTPGVMGASETQVPVTVANITRAAEATHNAVSGPRIDYDISASPHAEGG